MAKTGAIAKLKSMAKERNLQAGGIAKLAQSGAMDKLAKLLRGTQETLPAAERQANLAKFIEPSKTPMRLYHGTTATEGKKGQEAIKRIKPSKEGALGSGVYMTPKPTYAGEYTSGAGGNMLPVYAQIKNPLVIEGKGDPMIEALTKLGIDEDAAARMVERAYENKGYIGKEVESRARAAGYDGLMQYRDGDLSEVVSYNPNAVKSAIGNKGTYDTSSPELNKAKGGKVDDKAYVGYRRAGRRPESQQDREASANIPVAVARGLVSGSLGLPADLLNLPGAIYSGVTGKESYELPFGSEYIEKRLPFRGASQTPVGEMFTGAGQLAGGAYTGPLSGARAAMAVPRGIARAGRDFVQAAGQPAVNVIKPAGGNWLSGSVENALKDLKTNKSAAAALEEMKRVYPPQVMARMSDETRAQVQRAIPHLEKQVAINNWIDRNLGNYVKKQMATPDDPVRGLAEQGIVHIPSQQVGINRYRAPDVRDRLGTEQLGKSEAAQAWEDAADTAIAGQTAGKRKELAREGVYSHLYEPWMDKLDPKERVWAPMEGKLSEGMGFDHIIDVLKQDLDAGRIRPEQLSKVSMEQAVRRTYDFDQEMAKKMREAQIKATEGMPVHKEYPEGYRWI
jgi:hypothetical protein